MQKVQRHGKPRTNASIRGRFHVRMINAIDK